MNVATTVPIEISEATRYYLGSGKFIPSAFADLSMTVPVESVAVTRFYLFADKVVPSAFVNVVTSVSACAEILEDT